MLVDHERVLLDLKAEIASKGSHGQRDLLSLIARLEVAHRIEEGLPERALRLYGVVLSDDLLRPAHRLPVSGDGDGHDDRLAAGEVRPVPKEDTDGSQHHPAAGRDAARARPAPAAPRARTPA